MTETIDRNSRGQVTAIKAVLGTSTLLGLTNEFEASTNNGNLKSQTVAPLGIKQSYSYDNRNRLFSATEQPSGGGAVSWSQTFGYDDFGNRWVSAQSGALPGGGPRPNGAAWFQSGAPAVVDNRVTGLAYDAAGNQLTLGGMTGVYDGENRLRTTTTGDFSYDFDAFGRRVRTVAGGKTTCFVYDALGRLTAEYQVGATAGLQTRYLVQDQLGSTRLVTDGSGGVLRRSDYLPYGEEVPSGLGGRTLTGYGADGGVRQAFTGQMRDVETGLDFFGARFYSGALGRFTSPDPLLNSGRPWEPQSWNRYAYTLNNPLRFTDPTGMYEWDSKCKQNDSACEANRQQFRDAVGDLQKAASTFKEGSKERQQLDAILDKIGTEGDGNKTRIAFNSKMSDLGQTFGNKMTFNFKQIDQLLSKWDSGTVSTANAALVGHEGQHLVDGGNMFGGLKYLMSGADRVRKEIGSHTVESYVFQGFNRMEPFGYGLGVQRGDSAGWPLWNPSWAAADAEKLRQTNVGRVIEELYNKKK